ncbi:type II toxin-antitoxin system HicA family toxin [Sphingomonas gilva]|uniref:Type II toxin-antitoxin system HicA family toxin n=1 Tax=Sphingomonas gilva TaxID=2305907 RepID=A0A396RMR6_9SPHN|nr:type II toxin-antitoxin system HicA family toxin [Sphingomonas gilva]RHW17724.1 type II toxin-antitoxin system HicA family toxin [Sphingomonas gilva]
MARADKLLDAMRANPRDWRIEDVVTVCEAAGIACTAPRKGSHYKVKHESMGEILTIPARRPIKPVYVRALVSFVDAVRGVGG